MTSALFDGFDVINLLRGVAQTALTRLPDNLASIHDVERHFARIAASFPIENSLVLITDLFQLNRIKGKKELRKGFPGVVLTSIVGRIVDSDRGTFIDAIHWK